MSEQAVRAIVAYDGTDFQGFQRQATGRTVQAELETVLERLYGAPVTVRGAGRTDAGVHARGQVIAFLAPATIPPHRLPEAVQGLLPPDVAVRESGPADWRFDPRREALSRVYRYTLALDRRPDPLRDRFALRVAPTLDVAAVAAAGALLVGDHDFAAFCCSAGYTGSTRRRWLRVELEQHRELVTLEVEADSFLYKQIRCTIGVLLSIGQRRFGLDLVTAMLRGQPRPPQIAVAPPAGLVLERVHYGSGTAAAGPPAEVEG